MADRPVFYFDLGSPYSYLTAERVSAVMGVATEWQPVLLGAIHKAADRRSWAVTDEREAGIADCEQRADGRGFQPFRWPDPFPGNTLAAMRAATFAKRTGRTVAFALAAFRQAFAAGRDLTEIDNILIAAAACELHPNAVLKALETQAVKDDLRAATEVAIERGVIGVPTVAVGDELFWGDDRLEEAALQAGSTSDAGSA